ncbi:hypothetical protein BS78_04G104300 [Paspalum vaginatum]|nr:hypothetical protein BS78_04G104300 [Paspalum vaginatum]
MSSGSTIIMIPSAARSSGGGRGDDDVECRACYGVVAACVSMLLFCVLAATAGVVKACAVTGFVVVFCGVIGWLVPGPGGGSGSATATSGGAMRARRAAHGDAGATVALRRAGFVGRLVGAAAADVPPAFAYEGPAADSGGSSGKHGGGGALCAVCLEDVRRGETVRRLPACGHLFHRDCVDMWLHSHTTCPLCRCQLSPRRRAAKAVATPAAAQPSGEDALPPV